jgi:hypothetical protein
VGKGLGEGFWQAKVVVQEGWRLLDWLCGGQGTGLLLEQRGLVVSEEGARAVFNAGLHLVCSDLVGR